MSEADDGLLGPGPPADRPLFHVAPRCGWLNDPNGLVFWKGRHHL